MRKWILVMVLVLVAAQCAGCATVQKKFTRKKKEPPHIPAVMAVEEVTYKKYSNDYYYKTHYTMWKSWHDELMNQLGGNSKKVARCAQETFGNLSEMSRYLNPAKQAELRPLLDELTQITRRLEDGSVSSSELGGVRVELEKIKRIVANNFTYDKVKPELLADTVDLGEPAKGATATQ